MNQDIQPVKSKYSYCPACRIGLGPLSSYVEPNMRAVFITAYGKELSDLTHFQYTCRRCEFVWNESAPTNLPDKPVFPPNNSVLN